MPSPSVVAHCDWSTNQKKRWMAVALRTGHSWRLSQPEQVGETSGLSARLLQRASNAGPLLLGFDFPIGLPESYGKKTGLDGFLDGLRQFGNGEWKQWYAVCERMDEISVQRPFYPMRPGGTRQEHLVQGLGFTSSNELLRQCEKATVDRNAACALFWTLGGNQVGKGAISGWREVLAPNIDRIGIWPFGGTLDGLLARHQVVVAETYPGDVYRQLGIPRNLRWSKRAAEGRRVVAPFLMEWLDTRAVQADAELRQSISAGFASGAEGEDQFDALVGLFGMLDVADGRRSEGAVDRAAVGRWEGWILGQALS